MLPFTTPSLGSQSPGRVGRVKKVPKNERTFLRRSRFLDAISSLLLVASFATDSYDGKTWQGYQFLAGSLCVRSAPRQSFTSLTAADLVAKSSTGHRRPKASASPPS